MRRGPVDLVAGLALIGVLLAGMGFAGVWRHGAQASLPDSAGAIVQLAAGLALLAGLAAMFVLPALSRRRREREPGSGFPIISTRLPDGEGPIIEGEVLEPERRPGRPGRD